MGPRCSSLTHVREHAAALSAAAGPAAGAAGLGYALLLGFALVYLGEHYVADLLAGGALALAVATAGPLAAPAARRLDNIIRSLEPYAPLPPRPGSPRR